MKKMIYVSSLVLLATLLLTSCKNKLVVIKDVPADKIETVFNVKNAETLTIEIPSNVTTGFNWVLANKIKPNIITKLSNEYIGDESSENMVGVGGKEIWKFKAEKPGTTFLYFVYQREDKKIEKELYYKVIVKE